MKAVAAWLAMGGYAVFVWPAYAVALTVLGGFAFWSWRRRRRAIQALDRLEAGSIADR
jgi:heme exporter protein D